MRRVDSKTPYLILALLFLAAFGYFFIPTTWTGDKPLLTLGGQSILWPSSTGDYAVIYMFQSTLESALRLKSARLMPNSGVPGVKQVALRLETPNGILKEEHTLEGTPFDLSGRRLSRDELVGFTVVFDPAEASKLTVDSWEGYARMPHSQIEVSLTYRGHPYRVVLSLEPLK